MITKLKLWYARHQTYKQTFKELNCLSDHELHDLGLSRSDVEVVAYEAAYGKDSRHA